MVWSRYQAQCNTRLAWLFKLILTFSGHGKKIDTYKILISKILNVTPAIIFVYIHVSYNCPVLSYPYKSQKENDKILEEKDKNGKSSTLVLI